MARRVDFGGGAGFGFATALAARFFAGNGLKTGPAGVLADGLFRGSHVLLEADCCVFVEDWWCFDGEKLQGF